MVVLNKIDENPGFEVNRRFLQDKYPNIKGFYRVSCATGKGIKDFKKALTRELAAVELIRTTWAKNWFKVKTRLEQMTGNFISYQQYQDICKKENIPEESAQDTLVDYLNDLGVILHFKDFQLEDKRLDTTALVKADEREKKIFIFVSGTQKRDYFAVLRKTFHDIHDSFEKLEVDEWIPLPDNNKIAVEYKELLGYERAGREEIFIGKLEKAYSVQKLLSGIEKPGDRQPGVINREIIKPSRETPPSEPVKKGKKIIDSFWKIAAVIGGLIAFLAALAAIIDSQAVKNFFKWLFG